MKITKSQMIAILFGLLFLGSNIASAEYKPYTEQDTKQQKMEKRQQKLEAKQEKKEMKQKGMKEK